MITSPTTAAVRSLYEAFAYPRYPLFVPLQRSHGYAASSDFARNLALHIQRLRGGTAKVRICQNQLKTLIAGCGDTQPYIMAPWEGSSNLTCIDLSKTNLRRARLRFGLKLSWPRFVHADLNDYLDQSKEQYHHIDCFGVLHHTADPKAIIEKLAARLLPGGTMRVMIYNRESRQFIRHLQRAFASLGLSPYHLRDRQYAHQILLELSNISSSFGMRMRAMRQTIQSPSLFVDTFFQPREAQISILRWISLLVDAGLMPLGLFDRYGELDHLPNPLVTMPSGVDLQELAESQHFAGNFELYLQKDLGAPVFEPAFGRLTPWQKFYFAKQQPPPLWFSFSETASLPWYQRKALWLHYLSGYPLNIVLNAPARKRLARLGALRDEQHNDAMTLNAPSGFQSENEKDPIPHLSNTPIAQLLERVSSCPKRRNIASLRLLKAVRSL